MHTYSRHNTFFWLRNFLIIGQVVVWLMTKYIWGINYPVSVLSLSMVYLVINILYWMRSKNPTDIDLFINLFFDIVELSLFFYLTGGASNPFTWFLLIPIIFSATVLQQKYTWLLTGLSILSYTLLIKFFQPVETAMDMSMMNHQQHTTSFSQHLIGMWLGFIVIALIIAWVIIGLLRNIRQKEALLMQANLKQAQNDKMLALATLATGSAHELGTPLATINIIAKEMLNDSSIAQHHKSLSLMESQILRCKDSLAEITASTGTTQAIKGSVASVDDFLAQLRAQVMPPKSIDFSLNPAENNDDRLLIDKTLVQALVNIINNAFESQASKVSITTKITNQQLHIYIIDNGDGSHPQFEQPIKSEKEFGMGLGLFLAQATIQRFSGKINVQDNTDLGTTVKIILPLHNQL